MLAAFLQAERNGTCTATSRPVYQRLICSAVYFLTELADHLANGLGIFQQACPKLTLFSSCLDRDRAVFLEVPVRCDGATGRSGGPECPDGIECCARASKAGICRLHERMIPLRGSKPCSWKRFL